MSNSCRFCLSPHLVLTYPASKKTFSKSPSEFTCTNCGFGSHGPIVHCLTCDIYYVDEKIAQKEISTFYEVAEDPLYYREQDARRKTFLRYLKNLETYLPTRGKLLDVGTLTGLFVKLAIDNGWHATGIEPGRESCAYARKTYAIDLINKPFGPGLFPKNSLDAITMWDVIEHFEDPIRHMKTIYHYLKPGGLFAFSTIDPGSFIAQIMGTKWPWFMEMHRVYLGRKASNYYLKQAGFSAVSFTAHWRYLSLEYLSTRLQAVSPALMRASNTLCTKLGLCRVIVPYRAFDLYECYAIKPL